LQPGRAGIRGEDAGEHIERGFLERRRTRPGDRGDGGESRRGAEGNPAEAGAETERRSGVFEKRRGVPQRHADVAAPGFVGASVRIAFVAEEDRPGAERGRAGRRPDLERAADYEGDVRGPVPLLEGLVPGTVGADVLDDTEPFAPE